jgi:polysaccharide export outer membrane protein
MILRLFLLLIAVSLSACGTPADGPSARNIENATLPNSNTKIQIVDLEDALPTLLSYDQVDEQSSGPGLSPLRSRGASTERLRPGDVIEVKIFDTGEETILSTASSSSLDLGRFTVSDSGFVSLPYVGRQRVIESTPQALEGRIVNALKGSSVNPQAVVTVVEKPSSEVVVNGSVRSPGQFPLSTSRERILDVLARAGGASEKPGLTSVTLIRGGQRATARLDRIMAQESQNVYVFPGDRIQVETDAPSFMAFGAFKSVGEFQFEKDKLTLAQALGRAGGLLDDRADARKLYVFRPNAYYTPKPKVASVGGPTTLVGSPKPIIYRVNLRDVTNYALMQQFKMKNGDILYAGNAALVDFAKLFTVFEKSVPTAAAPQPQF